MQRCSARHQSPHYGMAKDAARRCCKRLPCPPRPAVLRISPVSRPCRPCKPSTDSPVRPRAPAPPAPPPPTSRTTHDNARSRLRRSGKDAVPKMQQTFPNDRPWPAPKQCVDNESMLPACLLFLSLSDNTPCAREQRILLRCSAPSFVIHYDLRFPKRRHPAR